MSDRGLRIAVTGLTGQVVSALINLAPSEVEIIPLGRPQLDLSEKSSVLSTLRTVSCDVIINAAAYTAVDKAESEPEVAMRINGEGAGSVAEAAAELGVPLVHLSTDYVFDGTLYRSYREDDPTCPSSAYGRSKLAGEKSVSDMYQNHVILRTAWVYSPYGINFVKTMLRLGETRSEINVVADQLGNPTYAGDIAKALFVIARRLIVDPSSQLRGIFHLSGRGEASWADLATATFESATHHGRSLVNVRPISTTDYPTPASRPANSRLDNSKLQSLYGLSLPHWRESIEDCVSQILQNS